MPDPETAAILRAILEELCASIPPFDAHTRTNVASSLLETVKHGRPTVDDLRLAGRQALRRAPVAASSSRSSIG